MTIIAPNDRHELSEAIADATAKGIRLEIRGGGSKAPIGAARGHGILDMSGFSGVIDYQPSELLLVAGAATPLAEVEALLAQSGQMLAFEPFDCGALLGVASGRATLGGCLAAGVAGPRRVSAGGARDHLLGFEAVSGRGERFIAGGKVVKNVTGYDLSKLMAGSWGRLAALVSVNVKVMPAPRAKMTLVRDGLSARDAQRMMAAAMGSQANVAAAAHVPGTADAKTALRLEGFQASIAPRSDLLRKATQDFGPLRVLEDAKADAFWRDVRDVAPLKKSGPLWRINLPPSSFPVLVDTLEPMGAQWMADWAGHLLWIRYDGPAATVRDAADAVGGHAMLYGPSVGDHAETPSFHPQSAALQRLSERVRRAFDPAGIFETGRFLD